MAGLLAVVSFGYHGPEGDCISASRSAVASVAAAAAVLSVYSIVEGAMECGDGIACVGVGGLCFGVGGFCIESCVDCCCVGVS